MIAQSVSCILYSVLLINQIDSLISCDGGFSAFVLAMFFCQKFSTFFIGMFLILIIHYLAKQSKKALDYDYSSEYESEHDFFNRKDSWIMPKGSIKQVSSEFSSGPRKSLEYQEFEPDIRSSGVSRSVTLAHEKVKRRLSKANIRVIERIIKRRTRLLHVQHSLDC